MTAVLPVGLPAPLLMVCTSRESALVWSDNPFVAQTLVQALALMADLYRLSFVQEYRSGVRSVHPSWQIPVKALRLMQASQSPLTCGVLSSCPSYHLLHPLVRVSPCRFW